MINIKRKKLMTMGLGILTAGFLAACATPTTPSETTTTKETTTLETKTTTQASGTTPTPSSNIVSVEYPVAHDGIQLYGKITAPADYKETKRPIVIMSHGFRSNLESFTFYAENLAKQGYVVYSFDFFSGSPNSRSGGNQMLEMSVTTEEKDLDAVVNQLISENFVDDSNVILLGASQGGVVTTLYAADHPEKVSKVVLFYPAFVLFDDVQETYRNLGVKSQDEIPSVVNHHNAQVGALYLKDAMAIDINEKIKAVKAPVLIVHGTNDNTVPYSYAVDANKTFADSELVTVNGGGHRMNDLFNGIAYPALQQFLQK
jgi:feruloyl esterase